MAHPPTRLAACALLTTAAVFLLGCTGEESATSDTKINLGRLSGLPDETVDRAAPARPALGIGNEAPTGEIRQVGLSQTANPEWPAIAGPRLPSPEVPEGETIEPTPPGGPQLLRLPPVSSEVGPPEDVATQQGQPTTASRPVPVPRLPDAQLNPTAPWLWRSASSSEENPSSDPVRPVTDQPIRLPPPPPVTQEPELPVAEVQTDFDPAGLMSPTASPRVSPPAWAPPNENELPANVPPPQHPPATCQASDEAIDRALAAVERGIELAERKAIYSARAEFVQALRTIARALDQQDDQTLHLRALDAGLRALREAQDFVPRGPEMDTGLDVRRFLPGHRTPVLKEEVPQELTPRTAQQRYHAYAQQQFVLAGGVEPLASQALLELGKISLVLYKDESESLGNPTAMVYYDAAATVDPQNAEAANELGVLLASCGQLQDARQALLQSLSAQRTAEAWHNLWVVHRRLGETDLAQRAKYEWELAVQASGQSPADVLSDRTTSTNGNANVNPAVESISFSGSVPESEARVDSSSSPGPSGAATWVPATPTHQEARKTLWGIWPARRKP